jgi:hypothetical protein
MKFEYNSNLAKQPKYICISKIIKYNKNKCVTQSCPIF